MMWDRRTVLKTLLSLGISQGIGQPSPFISPFAALAAPSSRKLALLVGANLPDLPGCLTDVELQRDLLIDRFGFHPTDIVTLTGDQATADTIAYTFISHLVEQAKGGDGVIFHYSGYGSQIKGENSAPPPQIPLFKGLFPQINPKIALVPLSLDSLKLLGRSLTTDKFTAILDTSYGLPPSTYPSHFPIRSLPLTPDRLQELDFSLGENLQNRLKNSNNKAKRSFNGLYLLAAQEGQAAVELIAEQFRTGLFTYLLTQSLWQLIPPQKLILTLAQTAQQMTVLRGEQQQPQVEKGTKPFLLTYHLLPEAKNSAIGLIKEVLTPKTVKIRLNALPYPLINDYGINSTLALVEHPEAVLRIQSRVGLDATAELLTEDISLEVGQGLQEKTRVLPRPITLSLALDSQLQRIERVDATSALASITAVGTIHNTGEGKADCLLAKTPKGSYALFSAGGNPLPNTEGKENEAIKSALERLNPYFQQELAFKLYQLTLNEASSRLGVKVTLEKVESPPQPISQRQTQPPFTLETSSGISLPTLTQGSLLQYRLENKSDRPIYVFLVGLTPDHQPLFGLLNTQGIEPDKTDIFSANNLVLNNNLTASPGLYQIYCICSQAPLKNLQKTLDTAVVMKNIASAQTFLALAQSLLEDLSLNTTPDSYTLETDHWATLNFVYRVL